METTEELPLAAIEGNGQPLSAADPAVVRTALEDRGAMLLRGFATTLDDFAALGDALCSSSMFNESPNRALMQGGSKVQSVDLGNDPFPLHPELAREPWRPDLCMFTCLGVPSVGGQTNLCDGIAVVEELPAELVSELAQRNLVYIKVATPEMLRFWLGTDRPDDALLANPPVSCPYWFRQAQGQVLRGFIRPVFERTIFQDKPAWANFLFFARDYLHKPNIPLLDDGRLFPDEWLDTIRSTARRLTYAHNWRQGDVLLADNSRFMHGRRAIADAGERQVATYFGYLRGVGPRPGEPPDPVWRRERFVPPDTKSDN